MLPIASVAAHEPARRDDTFFFSMRRRRVSALVECVAGGGAATGPVDSSHSPVSPEAKNVESILPMLG